MNKVKKELKYLLKLINEVNYLLIHSTLKKFINKENSRFSMYEFNTKD
ncbi:hypothetical protein [Tenacibaculum sp.]